MATVAQGPDAMSRTGMMFIDNFSTTLGDLPVRAKRDPIKVFDRLVDNKRFSVFDVDDHLAPAVDFLLQNGMLKTDLGPGYPWTIVAPTERGIAWRAGTITPCLACGGKGFISKRRSRRTALAEPCQNCGSTGWAASQAAAPPTLVPVRTIQEQ